MWKSRNILRTTWTTFRMQTGNARGINLGSVRTESWFASHDQLRNFFQIPTRSEVVSKVLMSAIGESFRADCKMDNSGKSRFNLRGITLIQISSSGVVFRTCFAPSAIIIYRQLLLLLNTQRLISLSQRYASSWRGSDYANIGTFPRMIVTLHTAYRSRGGSLRASLATTFSERRTTDRS